MKSKVTEEKGLKRKLEFIVPVQDVENCFSENYKKIQKKAKMPGFRQGKVPVETLKKTYKSQVYKAVLDDLFQSFYFKALQDNHISPAGPPTLVDLDLQEGKDCRFLIELEVHPYVQVKDYEGLELKQKNTNVTTNEVSETLEKLRQSCAKFEDSKNLGPIQKGQFCVVNLEGFLQNQRKTHYPNLLLELGKDMVAPNFDDHLIGLKLNDKKEFNFSFPKNHPDSKIADQKLLIKIQIIGFKDKHVPDLNDDLAKRFKLKNLEELKNQIQKDLKSNLEKKVKEEMENDIIQKLMEKNPIELPVSLIKEQKKKLQDNSRKRLEEYKMSQVEQEAFIKEKDSIFEKEARDSLHLSYLFEQLIKDLKIKATEEDIKKSLEESFPKSKPEEMEKELKKGKYWNSFVFNLTRQKVISYLIEKANIKQ